MNPREIPALTYHQKSGLKQNAFDMLNAIRLNELNMIDAARAKSTAADELLQYDRELTSQYLSFTLTYKEALK